MASPIEVIPLSASTQQRTVWYDERSLPALTERASIQTSHRLAAIAIFATLAAWFLLYQGNNDHWAGAIALAASDLGMCAAVLAGICARRQGRRPTRETTGVFIANLVLIALSLQLMLFARLGMFRSVIEKFFSS